MCGRCACTLAPDKLQEACSYLDDNFTWTKPQWLDTCLEYRPFYNGGPTTVLPSVTSKDHFSSISATEKLLVPMRWSLATNFATSHAYHTHNARAESLLTSNLYRSSVEKGLTCVVVMDGFYEWQTTGNAKKRQPYFLYKTPPKEMKGEHWDKNSGWDGRSLLKIAGIFNYSAENECYCCSVLTTNSSDSFAWLHHRMPVFLNSDALVNLWLDKASTSADNRKDTIEMLVEDSTKNTKLLSHPVNPAFVNKSTCNEPQCLEPVTLKKECTLDKWFKK